MPRPRTDAEPEAPKVLEKALRVLEAFGDQSPAWSEAALRRHLSIPSTTLNRILRSLERSGYLVRYDDGRYQLGVAAIRLGNRASRTLNLATVLDSHLRALARETGELAMLAVPEFPAGVARYIHSIESASRLRVTAEVGTAVPITAGATAKAIFAFLPADRIELVLSRKLRPLAAGTITDPAVLREQVREIRERGWAFSWEETYNGAWAVGAPLVDLDKQTALAAIGVAVPTSRHNEVTERAAREAVLETVEAATRILG
ncbi:MAG TPA: IclR family transcriptional regulator [Solirubrobacteraceae bacterium]|nr:IclR family transcriptional regulator [Solirubrobacteraceae bacterium]